MIVTYRRCSATVTGTSAWFAYDAEGDLVARVISDAARKSAPKIWVAHRVTEGMTLPARAKDADLTTVGVGFHREAALRALVAGNTANVLQRTAVLGG